MGFQNVYIGPDLASRDFHALLPVKIQKGQRKGDIQEKGRKKD
jgi:hypothetical protein